MNQPIAGRLLEAVSPLFAHGPPVRIRAWDGSEAGPPTEPVLVLRSPAALRHVLWAPGELGVARAYVSGQLDIPGDLTGALRRVHAALDGHSPSRLDVARAAVRLAGAFLAVGAIGWRPPVPNAEARLHGRRHTPRRDARVVAHHYDLSNELFALLLDEAMAYSCAYWSEPGYTLADAQSAKLELICRKLGLAPGCRLLDIGCGWGALAVHAATRYGAQVVGITLSAHQFEYASRRVAEAGVTDRVRLARLDYRDLPSLQEQPFDAVSAIEMGEHVGAGRYHSFLRTAASALRPGGSLLIQQMSRRSRFGGGPFIESYIAPDMHMRPLGQTVALIEDNGFEVRDVQSLREHYVRTIRAWQTTLEDRLPEVVAIVGEEESRVWRLYLAGAALAFEDERMGVDQITALRRPVPVGLPEWRAERTRDAAHAAP